MTHTNAEKMIKNAPATDFADDLGQILNRLGNPEKRVGIIKIYGTSGKSSVCTLLSSVLSAAGYKVGRLTTPFVRSISDSICVYEKPISKDFFTESADKVYKAVSDVKRSRADGAAFAPSAQSLLFATALSAFADLDCDYAIIEIPNDNISHTIFNSPIISVICSTGSEESAKSICARLDRNSKEVVSALQSREVYKIISDKCAEINTRLTLPIKNSFIHMRSSIKRTEFTYNGNTYLNGCGAYYQVCNMLTVIEATQALKRSGIKIAGTDICSAVLYEGIPLRFEIISIMPTIIVDRADTKERRSALIESLKKLYGHISSKPTVICCKDKAEISSDLAAMDYAADVIEIDIDNTKKYLRDLCPSLTEESTVIVIGSSDYCDQASKIIKEIWL